MFKKGGSFYGPTETKDPIFHRFSRLRGRKVFDRDGKEIGTLEDLFIHQDERRLHYLDVRAGGFLGLGKRIFLIPMHLVEEYVRIE